MNNVCIAQKGHPTILLGYSAILLQVTAQFDCLSEQSVIFLEIIFSLGLQPDLANEYQQIDNLIEKSTEVELPLEEDDKLKESIIHLLVKSKGAKIGARFLNIALSGITFDEEEEIEEGSENDKIEEILEERLSKLANLVDLTKFLSVNYFRGWLFELNTQDYAIDGFTKLIDLNNQLNEIKEMTLGNLTNLVLNKPSLLNEELLGLALEYGIGNMGKNEEFSEEDMNLVRAISQKFPAVMEKHLYDPTPLFMVIKTNVNSQKCKVLVCDVIGAAFRFRTDVKEKIGLFMADLLYKEGDITVLCHIVNCLIDVFAEDDANQVLFATGLLEYLSKNADQFENLLKQKRKAKEIDRETFSFGKLCHSNMIEFVKYKINIQ